MSYYQGDMGGRMYRGDPGFFSFLGGLAKSVVGMLPGGSALSKITSIVKRPASSGVMSAGREIIAKGGRTIAKHPVLSAAGAAGALAAGGLGAHALLGRHHGGKRHRRLNPCNPRALRRAIRRTHAFAKLAMRTIHIVHPKKKGHFGGFKKRSHKR